MHTVNILDYLVLIVEQRRFLVRVVLGGTAVAAVLILLLLPRWYKSVATIMPPKQKNVLGLLDSIARPGSASLRSLGLGGTSDDLAQFQTILVSRRVMQSLVRKFDLMAVYDLETEEKAIKELRENSDIAPGEEDVSLEIAVYDRDPERAAALANAFVGELNTVYLEMSVAEAKSNREFLETRYQQNLSDLRAAEEALKEFQERNRVYAVSEQVKAAVEAAAEIQSQIMLREVQLGIVTRSAGPDDPGRQAMEQEIAELRKQMRLMRVGGPGEGQLFAPFEQTPELGMEYFRRYRDVEIQGRLLELLLPLYEQARIEEQRNTPTVLVLDTAVPAIRHARPKRMLLIALAGAFLVLVAVAVIVARDALRRASADADVARKLTAIRQSWAPVRTLLRRRDRGT